ncbi:MAG: biotin transporter BioY [Clostridia bacterium]|nr:biotin transporter BioY [Clostridia bacterium]
MKKAKNAAAIGVLAALYSVTALAVVPFPTMPLSLQCFAVALGAYIFGFKIGISATAVYVAMGAVGLPVFAGMKGGAGMLFGATGGFIWGFLIVAALCGLVSRKGGLYAVLFGLLSLVLAYGIGILQYAFVTGTYTLSAISAVFLPLFIKDMVLIPVAVPLSALIKKELNKSKNRR